MLVTFSFGAPFDGRIYAVGNAPACFEMGNGQTQVVLRLPIGNICGTVEQVYYTKLHNDTLFIKVKASMARSTSEENPIWLIINYLQ